MVTVELNVHRDVREQTMTVELNVHRDVREQTVTVEFNVRRDVRDNQVQSICINGEGWRGGGR